MKFIKINKELSLSPLTECDFPIFINRINDYNVYNKAITKRIKHLQKDKISSKNVGDAGVYLFGSSLVPLEGDILNNPWKKIMEGKSINKRDGIDEIDFT